ncbi:hypothetical protein M422DRAFT_263843 [Sphaerobolus stellatus SS14]|uniref:Uncharacterized protein n=1 Tax=Sphaerobolus stellatus (strain SS14) TaxID=990650 RepID=A0A0C9UXN5_SPHS4|nr:hypothetical protein M422DRAFT_263843 [Sphaerobolus stellatus SS14]
MRILLEDSDAGANGDEAEWHSSLEGPAFSFVDSDLSSLKRLTFFALDFEFGPLYILIHVNSNVQSTEKQTYCKHSASGSLPSQFSDRVTPFSHLEAAKNRLLEVVEVMTDILDLKITNDNSKTSIAEPQPKGREVERGPKLRPKLNIRHLCTTGTNGLLADCDRCERGFNSLPAFWHHKADSSRHHICAARIVWSISLAGSVSNNTGSKVQSMHIVDCAKPTLTTRKIWMTITMRNIKFARSCNKLFGSEKGLHEHNR